MTYVPAILLVGLICMLVASTISLLFLGMNFRSVATRRWRIMHTLRLLFDAVDGLHNGIEANDSHHLDDTELEKWARDSNVRYVVNENGDLVLEARVNRQLSDDEAQG